VRSGAYSAPTGGLPPPTSRTHDWLVALPQEVAGAVASKGKSERNCMAMRLLRRWVGSGLTLAVGVVVMSFGSVAGASKHVDATPTTTVNCGVQQASPQEFTSVQSCLQSQFPDNYGGAYVSGGRPNTRWTIVEVHHTPSLEAAAVSGLHGLHVSFNLAPYTYVRLTKTANEIRTSVPSLAGKGAIRYVSVGLNPEKNRVVVWRHNPRHTRQGPALLREALRGMVDVTFTSPATFKALRTPSPATHAVRGVITGVATPCVPQAPAVQTRPMRKLAITLGPV
jgi:hypothetical protein